MAGGGVRLTYNSSFIPSLEQALHRRLEKIGVLLSSEVRRNLSVSTRANGPSAPGGFPHADTGTLRKSISYAVDRSRLEVRVGSTVLYAPWLEDGTTKMAARPYLRRTARDLESRILNILTRRIKGQEFAGKMLET